MESIDIFLRNTIDLLQYVTFFSALVVFGLLELFIRRSHLAPSRARRWPVNFGLTALNIVILGVIPLSGLVVSDFAHDSEIGLLHKLPMTPIVLLVAGILVRSLVSWIIHFAMHKIPMFWRIHRVHHTDTQMDISTTVRFHPLEFLISTPIVLAAILAAGIPPIAVLVYELFDAAMAVFTHSNIRMNPRLERALRLLLITPDMHRVHHSTYQAETDSNYGATFSIWDRLFGTLRTKESAVLASMELGLEECQDRRSCSLGWLLILPFRPGHIPAEIRTSDPHDVFNRNQGEAV